MFILSCIAVHLLKRATINRFYEFGYVFTLVYLNSRDRVRPVGAGWQKRRLQSKMAAETEIFRVSPQQVPILQNLSCKCICIQMKYVTEHEKLAGSRLKHSSVPCDEFGRVIESTVFVK